MLCPGMLESALLAGIDLADKASRVSLAKGPIQIHQKIIRIIEFFQKYPALFYFYSAISIGGLGGGYLAKPCKCWHWLVVAAGVLDIAPRTNSL